MNLTLPPGLVWVTSGTGIEVYKYTDHTDFSFVEIAVDNTDYLAFWERAGEPEMPAHVMRWLTERADYLAKGGEVTRGPGAR